MFAAWIALFASAAEPAAEDAAAGPSPAAQAYLDRRLRLIVANQTVTTYSPNSYDANGRFTLGGFRTRSRQHLYVPQVDGPADLAQRLQDDARLRRIEAFPASRRRTTGTAIVAGGIAWGVGGVAAIAGTVSDNDGLVAPGAVVLVAGQATVITAIIVRALAKKRATEIGTFWTARALAVDLDRHNEALRTELGLTQEEIAALGDE